MKPIHTLSDEEFAEMARRSATLEDAPEHVVKAAIGLWRVQPAKAHTVRTLMERAVAALTFDSWATPSLAFGVRNAPSETRQMLFSAEGRDIDLRITPAARGFAISGQILGPDASGNVELLRVGDDSLVATQPHDAVDVDDIGEFHLADVAAGRYQLILRVPDAEIELPLFEVGERHR
ncbi:MAG: hypothetical protein M3Z31_00370 [Pseudomonadota bacterium]|nr:hypothetical protein [Pseudomonadota bacterium]